MTTCLIGYEALPRVEVCLSGETPSLSSVFGHLLIETHGLDRFAELYKCLTRIHPVVSRLVTIYEEYDLPQFTSTHRAMTRRIIRLRKLVRILENLACEKDYYVLSVGKVLRPVTDRLRETIELLEFFKGEFHRDRDKVHQYTYPYILSLLETLKDDWVMVLRTYTAIPRIELVARIGNEPRIELEIETQNLMTTKELPLRAIEHLARKHRNSHDQIRVLHEIAEKIMRRKERKYVKPLGTIPNKLFSMR